MTIKCFGYGGPHKKMDCTNQMKHGSLIPLCGDCGPGHLVADCTLKISARLPQLPIALVNMIGTVTTPLRKEEPVPVLVVTQAQAQA